MNNSHANPHLPAVPALQRLERLERFEQFEPVSVRSNRSTVALALNTPSLSGARPPADLLRR